MRQVYEALLAAVDPAREVATTFAAVHATEIERRLQPRVNEQYWNV
ncbi:hypothetical protein GCM10017673_58370 [Streptosporangium violaceochromogenes]|nr:hypothetical protein GCM10017673_58370 [Streptosporangium violaceochromogenes]